MDNEETVDPQENVDTILEQQEVDTGLSQDTPEEQPVHETKVPLSALQKERKKRQDLEHELHLERQKSQAKQEEDPSRFEAATREDLSRSQMEAVRIVEEKLWVKQYPEKFQKVTEQLSEFLKQRPNLASAINSATNRYEEAYTLMEALTPKQQSQLKAQVKEKKDTPNSPASVPKAAALNEAVDVMSMSDSEFSAWRQSQKRRR